MKIIKRISILLIVAICAVCAGVFATACGDNNTANEFTVTVYYSDGTTVVNGTTDPYIVQICLPEGFCYNETPAIDANGKVTFDIAKVDAAAGEANLTFEVHVIPQNDYEPVELKEVVTVNSSNPTVKAVLKDVDAPAD